MMILYLAGEALMRLARVFNVARWALILYNKNDSPHAPQLSKKLKTVNAAVIVAVTIILVISVIWYVF